MGLSALFVGFNAAFFSVTGLAKLFAGASVSVMIMASSLELAKLITAGYLYNYWDKIGKGFRIYLTIGVGILILITSLGIYGFLTAAFQDTLNQYNVSSKQKAFLEQKESFWEKDVTRYDKELERISNNISTLSNAKSTGIQVRDTTSSTGFRQTISTTELRLSQKRISVEEENRKEVQLKREVAADSLQSIQLKILELDTDTESSSELGPLQYLSTLLDKPMTDIINWFILIIIFVFDPLAVALVIAFNNAVKVDKGEKDKKKVIQKRELYGEEPDKETQRELIKEIIKADEKDGLYDDWNTTLQDGLDDVPYEDSKVETDVDNIEDDLTEFDTIMKGYEVVSEEVDESNLDIDGDGIITDEEREADLDGDGKISEEEERLHYENGGWRSPYNGKSYFHHPWFDWKKTERWVNDRRAIDYWLKYRGGTANSLEKLKGNQYPDNFNSKTY